MIPSFMKFTIVLCAFAFVGILGWRLGGTLSSDAIGMALGVLFGIMAGIPAALMALAAKRHEEPEPRRPYAQLPPVILVTGTNPLGQGVAMPYSELDDPTPEYRVSGEGSGPIRLDAPLSLSHQIEDKELGRRRRFEVDYPLYPSGDQEDHPAW